MRPNHSDLAGSRILGGLLLAVAVAVSSGCGAKGKTTGKVSGQVLNGGQPVTEGEVHFHSKERGIGAVAKLDSSGNFALPAPIETGKYTVHVTPPPPMPVDPKLGKAKKVTSTIPLKARDPATSGLSYTVEEGDNNYKIELKK